MSGTKHDWLTAMTGEDVCARCQTRRRGLEPVPDCDTANQARLLAAIDREAAVVRPGDSEARAAKWLADRAAVLDA